MISSPRAIMDPELTAKTFIIPFEEDVLTKVEYHNEYRPRTLFRSKSTRSPSPRHEELPGTPDDPSYLVTETEISNSYLSATLSTIQPVGDHKSLLIVTIACHPAPERRFMNATVSWQITTPPSPSDSSDEAHSRHDPKVIALAPQHSIGGWTEEQTRLLWGLSAPVQVGFGPASVGLEPLTERESQKSVMHAMTILGTVRKAGTRATWTVEENKSSQRGIPSHFQLAIVVDHTGPFLSDFDVKAELGGGLWSTFLQAKKGKGGNGLGRIIDVETWKCGDILWEPGELGWKKYVAGITGEVEGVVLNFNQSVVRP
ncbi:hypothetical protein H0H87_001190 [Tephrocybe sp. NHM501043]|nr:hypothetical protein H0H87_001190 [Tephrocybe sp. NHM501043]